MQDDPRTAGAMDTYFRDALQVYADVPYKDLHAHLERRFRVWYTKFKPASAEVVGASVGGAEVGDIVSVEGVDGEAPPVKKSRYSYTFEYESAASAAPPPPPAPAASSDGEASGERTGPSSPALYLAALGGAPPA
jgi:hypothetical protein